MPVKKLKEFLDSNKVKYVSISHSAAYTAQEIAASAHVPGKELAKTVIVKIDGKLAMAVLPASCKVDLTHLKETLGAEGRRVGQRTRVPRHVPRLRDRRHATIWQLFDMEVYVSAKLAEDQEIAFNAGSHTELLKLAYKDFERLVKPKVVHFAAGKE